MVDNVLYLQNYKEGWKAGNFEEKYDYRDCIDPPQYHRDGESGDYSGWFWDHPHFRAREFKCLSVQGSTYVVRDLVLDLLKSPGSSIMLDRAEQLLHDRFGDADYWAARRCMRFNQDLIGLGERFRREQLGSGGDGAEGTTVSARWEDQQPERGTAKGGEYLCVHLRRKDFAHSRKDLIPTVAGAAEQVGRKLDELGLSKVFVSSDAPEKEFEEFRSLLPGRTVKRFSPSPEELRRLKDGGVAIVDQIICSHAR